MKAIDPTLPGDVPVPAAVYLLQRRDGLRFKIGWAPSPWRVGWAVVTQER